MFTVSRDFHFCYGHRLLDYQGKCAHLHGHNGIAQIVLKVPELDCQGMVVDFSELKATMGVWIENTLDHCMILCENDPFVPLLKERGEPVYLMKENPTAENLAKLIFNQARELGLPVQSVRFWETEKCSAEYSVL